jgi:hypothetical protein
MMDGEKVIQELSKFMIGWEFSYIDVYWEIWWEYNWMEEVFIYPI